MSLFERLYARLQGQARAGRPLVALLAAAGLLLGMAPAASQEAAPGVARQPMTGSFTDELSFLAGGLIQRHFPGMPLPRMMIETSMAGFEQGLGKDASRTLAYWDCPRQLIAINPHYQTRYGFAQLVDTVKHELVHAWLSWKNRHCEIDAATGGHDEAFLRKAIEMKLDLSGTLQAYPVAAGIHQRLMAQTSPVPSFNAPPTGVPTFTPPPGAVPAFTPPSGAVPTFGPPPASGRYSQLRVLSEIVSGMPALSTPLALRFNSQLNLQVTLQNEGDTELFVKARLLHPDGFCMQGNCALHAAFVSRQEGRCLARSACNLRLSLRVRTGAWTLAALSDGRAAYLSLGPRDPSLDMIQLDRRIRQLILFVDTQGGERVDTHQIAGSVAVNLGFEASATP